MVFAHLKRSKPPYFTISENYQNQNTPTDSGEEPLITRTSRKFEDQKAILRSKMFTIHILWRGGIVRSKMSDNPSQKICMELFGESLTLCSIKRSKREIFTKFALKTPSSFVNNSSSRLKRSKIAGNRDFRLYFFHRNLYNVPNGGSNPAHFNDF